VQAKRRRAEEHWREHERRNKRSENEDRERESGEHKDNSRSSPAALMDFLFWTIIAMVVLLWVSLACFLFFRSQTPSGDTKASKIVADQLWREAGPGIPMEKEQFVDYLLQYRPPPKNIDNTKAHTQMIGKLFSMCGKLIARALCGQKTEPPPVFWLVQMALGNDNRCTSLHQLCAWIIPERYWSIRELPLARWFAGTFFDQNTELSTHGEKQSDS